MLATICGGGIVIRLTSLSGLIPPEASQYRVHMACVPGGNVIAKAIGSPEAFARSTYGFRSLGVLTPASLSLLFSVIAWPLRFSSHGTTMGLTGDPSRPIDDARGIPKSMCVAWFSPMLILSRIAAHEASFEITD